MVSVLAESGEGEVSIDVNQGSIAVTLVLIDVADGKQPA